MALSSYWMHKIYIAATMNYVLGSDNPDELAYYNKIRKEMDDMKKQPDQIINLILSRFPSRLATVGHL